eukprot:CAMPEP_0180757578 /NCGR_PEP_ID=MMETSP1038_2-20121128/34838_1 /TAXON_ID=632150 /ORGANISM="Azadinium spinosum, Strain 3D9" /LENGTH=121 /DNA_ID=CAMNT_0022791635 /DNA_START=282 /DNA_END=648 /DNA_ORIENTATION=+
MHGLLENHRPPSNVCIFCIVRAMCDSRLSCSISKHQGPLASDANHEVHNAGNAQRCKRHEDRIPPQKRNRHDIPKACGVQCMPSSRILLLMLSGKFLRSSMRKTVEALMGILDGLKKSPRG